ncbi:MAG TPA: hypothetical protein VEM34_01915 [Burkholderiales bacterium]|nr:hypothetical protein [Burkholderiales bacterium]
MRAAHIVGILVACLVSLAVGFWLGVHQAWPLGIQAEFLARGVLATQNLQALRNGKGEVVATGLEADIDNGLLFGGDFLEHPLRPFLAPALGIELSGDYEQFAVRLANYRKLYPSPTKWESDPNIKATIAKRIEHYAK